MTSTVLSMRLLIQNINSVWVMVCTAAQAEFHPFNCMTGHLVLFLLPLCTRIIVQTLKTCMSEHAHQQNLSSLNLPNNIHTELLDTAMKYSSIRSYGILIIFPQSDWSVFDFAVSSEVGPFSLN